MGQNLVSDLHLLNGSDTVTADDASTCREARRRPLKTVKFARLKPKRIHHGVGVKTANVVSPQNDLAISNLILVSAERLVIHPASHLTEHVSRLIAVRKLVLDKLPGQRRLHDLVLDLDLLVGDKLDTGTGCKLFVVCEPLLRQSK